MGRSLQLAVVFVAALTGCDLIEVAETTYPDMATAASRGGVSSGWIPEWLPASSTDLRHNIHDVDTNESALAFNISSTARWRPPSQCQAVSASAVTPSRFGPSWWPSQADLESSYTFYSCPTDVSPTSMFVGIHKAGSRGLHWRVSAR